MGNKFKASHFNIILDYFAVFPSSLELLASSSINETYWGSLIFNDLFYKLCWFYFQWLLPFKEWWSLWFHVNRKVKKFSVLRIYKLLSCALLFPSFPFSIFIFPIQSCVLSLKKIHNCIHNCRILHIEKIYFRLQVKKILCLVNLTIATLFLGLSVRWASKLHI